MTILFWICVAILVYVYAGYPLVLFALSRRGRPTIYDEDYEPTVSLVIAAHNEEKVIRDKIENSLALNYPGSKLEIVVASDGSTDATNEIVQGYAGKGCALHELSRGGKTRALNTIIPQTTGEVLVLSDANTMYESDAIRKLVRHFSDPGVGAVSGDVRLVDAAATHQHSEGFYYKYERWLQRLESGVGSIIGADGAMYAVRRTAFRPPSDNIILDDFVISMTVAGLGYRVIYEPEAVAVERGTQTSSEEFRRKVRVVAGGFQALRQGEGVPGWDQPFLLFCYFSHKLLRWLIPSFLLILLLASFSLVSQPIYRVALIAQLLFYGIAAIYKTGLQLRRLPGFSIPYYFCLVNGAAIIGLWKGILGFETVMWNRTKR